MLCQVTCTVAKPFPDRPTEGFITFNTELSQMAAPSFEPGRPSELAIEVGRAVERGLRESRAIETEGLCIVAGEKVQYTIIGASPFHSSHDNHVLHHDNFFYRNELKLSLYFQISKRCGQLELI